MKNISKMTLEQLEAYSNELEEKRMAIKEEMRMIARRMDEIRGQERVDNLVESLASLTDEQRAELHQALQATSIPSSEEFGEF